jgi:hypothetical protein
LNREYVSERHADRPAAHHGRHRRRGRRRAAQHSGAAPAGDGPAHRAGREPRRRHAGPRAEEIRAAVADALAEERERELAEARAFWAAQESRDASDAPLLLGLADSELFLPRQTDFVGMEPVAEPGTDSDEAATQDAGSLESAELAAARRRHPSHPDFVPNPSPAVGDHESTVATLEELAESSVALADVRPGPLGTLDVYVFADGTTLCMTPGHRETAERLAAALGAGKTPYLLGGSGISGAYTLTFACGEENVYILADRVIASL